MRHELEREGQLPSAPGKVGLGFGFGFGLGSVVRVRVRVRVRARVRARARVRVLPAAPRVEEGVRDG